MHLPPLCPFSYSEYIVQQLPTQAPIITMIISIIINNVIFIYYKGINSSFKVAIELFVLHNSFGSVLHIIYYLLPEEPFIK